MIRALPHGEAFLFFSVCPPVHHSKFHPRRETPKLSVIRTFFRKFDKRMDEAVRDDIRRLSHRFNIDSKTTIIKERLGYESKTNFAKSQFLSRSTVTKFFQCQPIQLDSLKRICEALSLDWNEIVQTCEEEQSKRLEINDFRNLDTNEGVEQVQRLSRKVTVLDNKSKVVKAEIILEGDLSSINDNLSVLFQAILRENSGDTIKITDIKEGSIRLTIEGSSEDIEKLLSRFNSGELTEVSGFPVEDVQILSESSNEDESNELNDKWRLVQEIVSQRVDARNLSNADLSDADLSSADLSGADLSSADLSGADLSSADLSGADLSSANLSGADLRGANLIGARIDAQTKIDRKWHLVWKIVNQGASEQDLIGIDKKGANVRRVNLDVVAGLSGASLSDADLSGVNRSHADLSHADLSGANLSYADLSHADLSGANLSYADLSHADLSHAGLSGANLSGAKLSHANLIGADLRGVYLRGANLSGARLSRANLIGANLIGANLIGANLSRVYLRNTDLSGAVVEKARFGANSGLTEEMELDLKRRGAIFEDS